MSQTKGQLTTEMLHFLAAIVFSLLGRNITELDVRTICKEAGITAVGQTELSPALREVRDSLDCNPKDRLVLLMEALPEKLQLALLMIAQSFIEFRVEARFQEVEVKTTTLQQDLATSEHNRALAKEEAIRNAEECDKLLRALEISNTTQRDFTERIKTLERDNALLQGRLMEREANNMPRVKTAKRIGKGPKASTKPTVVDETKE